MKKLQRCAYCTNEIIEDPTGGWTDRLGSGCVASSDGCHHPVGEPPC